MIDFCAPIGYMQMNFVHKHNWLLVLQGWAILWIVLGNAYLNPSGNDPEWVNTLLRTAYTFHLPLLMFTSGCIFSKKFLLNENNAKTGESLKGHILGLLIPYLLFTLVAVIVKLIMTKEPSLPVMATDLIRGLFFPGLQPMSALWFILVLICYYLMLPIWKLTFEKSWYAWSFVILLLVVHLLTVPGELFAIKWACYFAFYFYLGVVIMKKGWLDHLSGMTGFFVFLIGYIVYSISLDVDKTMAEMGGIAFSMGLVLILNSSFPKTFSTFRDYYLQIFLMGYFVQILFRTLYGYLSIPYILGYLICLALGIYVPVIITKIIHSRKITSLYYYIGLSDNQPKLYHQNKLAVEL